MAFLCALFGGTSFLPIGSLVLSSLIGSFALAFDTFACFAGVAIESQAGYSSDHVTCWQIPIALSPFLFLFCSSSSSSSSSHAVPSASPGAVAGWHIDMMERGREKLHVLQGVASVGAA